MLRTKSFASRRAGRIGSRTMKRILLVLIVGLLGVPVVTGQSSPAASDSKTAETAPGSLTPEERTRAVEYLTQTQKEFPRGH